MSPHEPDQQNAVNPHRPNGWAMARDVLINATNKGQLLMAVLGFIIAIWIFRLPPPELYKLSIRLTELMEDAYMFGWILFFVLVPTFVIYHRRTIKDFNKKVERLNKQIKQLETSENKSLATSSSRKK